MAISKVILNGVTQMDVTDTTATADDVAAGKVFYAASGERTLGAASGGAVNSVNGQTGDVVLTATNVGAIPAPSSASAGNFLVYNGTAWVAQSLSTWQGGNY